MSLENTFGTQTNTNEFTLGSTAEALPEAIVTTEKPASNKPDTPPSGWRLTLENLLARWRYPIMIFLVWRIGLGIFSMWAGTLIPMYASRNGSSPFKPVYQDEWFERIFGIWGHWDGEWFMHIARVGYLQDDASSPFFPLYVLLMQAVSVFTNDLLVAGVLVSAITSLTAFITIYELFKWEFGDKLSERAVLYLAVFPTSFFLASVYSEALFLTLSAATLLAARKYHNWLVAGILIGLASLTRNLGTLLIVPVAWEWLRHNLPNLLEKRPAGGWKLNIQWRKLPVVDTVLLLFFPALLFGSWLAFQWVALGNPLKFIEVQSLWMWGRRSAPPWDTIRMSVELLVQPRQLLSSLGETPGLRDDPNIMDFTLFLFAAIMFGFGCWLAVKRQFPISYLLLMFISIVLPTISPAPQQPLMSFPRFALVIFPMYLVLAKLGERWKFLHNFYLFTATLVLAMLFARFANWYWVA